VRPCRRPDRLRLLEKKRLRWFSADGQYLGSVIATDPIRRVYWNGDAMVVETRRRRAIVQGRLLGGSNTRPQRQLRDIIPWTAIPNRVIYVLKRLLGEQAWLPSL